MPVFLKKNQSVILLIVLLLLQMILISLQVPLGSSESAFERGLFTIFAPLQHTVVSGLAGISGLWKNYIYVRDSRVRAQRLEAENLRLEQENRLLRESLRRYCSEDEMTRLLEDVETAIITARVIGIDSANPWKSLTINRGSMDGVRRNMVVLDGHGMLVGRVIGPVTMHESRVQLLTDNQAGISVSGPNGAPLGILSGHMEREGYCRLSYILATSSASLEEGDPLVTTGYDGIYPPGIQVGVIVRVRNTPDLFKDILVKPFFDLNQVGRLVVLKVDTAGFF